MEHQGNKEPPLPALPAALAIPPLQPPAATHARRQQKDTWHFRDTAGYLPEPVS